MGTVDIKEPSIHAAKGENWLNLHRGTITTQVLRKIKAWLMYKVSSPKLCSKPVGFDSNEEICSVEHN